MALQLVTPPDPALLPFTVDEAKLHVKVDYALEDSLIERHIRTAQEYAESLQGRKFFTATYQTYLDSFPKTIYLRTLPVQSVSSVKYIGSDGVLTTLDQSDYVVDLISRPARIVPAYGKCWPSVQPTLNAVQVEFVCGYESADDIPASTKSAMLLICGWLFANREPAPFEQVAVDNLLRLEAWGRV